MRFLIKLTVVLGLLGGVGFFAWQQGAAWLKERNKPQFRMAEVERGVIRITRNATGEVKPVLSVQVGSFVSGPIDELFVDFNDEVKKDQVLATIDPRLYKASVARDRAALANREAEVRRVQALLQRAINDEKRALALQAENRDYISQTEMDQYHFSRTGLEAQLTIAEASVEQAVANLENSLANLDYTEIRSPVDGVIIDCKISEGQTLAAQFQAPELFEIAPDMRKKMHIFASIDEADIGLIRQAQEIGESVIFKVDAYPGEFFREGVIEQVRLSSTTTQNVVTYPVVVATPNPEMKLLPGMTADLTFQVAEHNDVLKVPTAAIRYLPEDKSYVHEADHNKLDLSYALQNDDDAGLKGTLEDKPVDEAAQKAETRHVWILDGEKLRAVEIQVGVSDYKSREVVGGELKAGDKVVVGLKTKE
ncbi:MAG: efflux RND transporter periplasmic adaptor subunit [Fuerstiella sp.]